MEPDIIVGIVVLAVVLVVLSVLTLWTRRIIIHISSNGRSSSRRVLKGVRDAPKA